MEATFGRQQFPSMAGKCNENSIYWLFRQPFGSVPCHISIFIPFQEQKPGWIARETQSGVYRDPNLQVVKRLCCPSGGN